ncbi:MAG: hypothetical protein IJ760_02105 [Bacteroidales bacterium]|nr:hypothetical protein [Bacteroidales bacterium]
MRRIFLAAMAMAALVVTSCSKGIDLEKTQWGYSKDIDISAELLAEAEGDPEDIANLQEIIDMMGGKFIVAANLTLDFKTATTGVFTTAMRPKNIDKLPEWMQEIFNGEYDWSEDEEFTYTFSDNSGNIDFSDEKVDIDYDKSSKELIVNVTSEEETPEYIYFIGEGRSIAFKQK